MLRRFRWVTLLSLVGLLAASAVWAQTGVNQAACRGVDLVSSYAETL